MRSCRERTVSPSQGRDSVLRQRLDDAASRLARWGGYLQVLRDDTGCHFADEHQHSHGARDQPSRQKQPDAGSGHAGHAGPLGATAGIRARPSNAEARRNPDCMINCGASRISKRWISRISCRTLPRLQQSALQDLLTVEVSHVSSMLISRSRSPFSSMSW